MLRVESDFNPTITTNPGEFFDIINANAEMLTFSTSQQQLSKKDTDQYIADRYDQLKIMYPDMTLKDLLLADESPLQELIYRDYPNLKINPGISLDFGLPLPKPDFTPREFPGVSMEKLANNYINNKDISLSERYAAADAYGRIYINAAIRIGVLLKDFTQWIESAAAPAAHDGLNMKAKIIFNPSWSWQEKSE
jgi:hypothetical protein